MSRYIDADALLKELHKEKEENEKARMVLIDDDFETLIKDAPTVEPEPVRHGKWEQTEVDGGKIYVCSECSEAIYKSTFEENVHYYCNNCGAKMDKE